MSEIIAMHHFEPSLRGIYVEGTTDQSFLRWFMTSKGLHHVAVYPIDSITIADCVPTEQGGGGHKGRVMSFAMELSARGIANALGVVDKDMIGICCADQAISALLLTDHGCMESYFLYDKPFMKLFSVFFEKSVQTTLITSARSVLSDLFLLRCAKFEIHSSAPWIDNFKPYLKLAGSVISIDLESYSKSIANASSRNIESDVLLNTKKRIQERVPARNFDCINKNDALLLVGWIAKELGVPTNKRHPDVIPRAMALSAELDDIAKFSLFQRLEAWAA